jgi:hypothetical protein
VSGFTIEDMDNLRHMLGIDALLRKPSQWGFRNYYHCDIDDPSMERLLAAGLVRSGRGTTTPSGRYMNFHATYEGCRMAGLTEEKSREVGK